MIWDLAEIDGDLALTDAGDLLLVQGAHAVAQAIRVTLETQRGAWFLDTSLGVDWAGVVFRPGAGDAEIAAEILTAILGVVGVVGVSDFRATRGPARRLLVAFRAQTAEGVLSVSVEAVGAGAAGLLITVEPAGIR